MFGLRHVDLQALGEFVVDGVGGVVVFHEDFGELGRGGTAASMGLSCAASPVALRVVHADSRARRWRVVRGLVAAIHDAFYKFVKIEILPL